MTARTLTGILVLVIAQGVAGCGGSSPSPAPSAPSPVPQPAPYQVSGVVVDSASRVIAGASVEVLDGPQRGLATTSDPAGAFSLTGIFEGTTRFRGSKDGYVAAIYMFPSIVTTKRVEFQLGVLAAPAKIAGDYTATFMADSACVDLPADVRTRTYAAAVTPRIAPYAPANTQFVATLSGATVDAYYHVITIEVAGDYLFFDLSDNYLLEEVAEETYLAIGGAGSASPVPSDASTISVTIQGLVDYCVARSEIDAAHYACPANALAHAQCESKNHRLILTRR
jgi:Carboxypeptidase regulatory-like domain